MLGWRKQVESIEVAEKKHGYFPQRFRWHGHMYIVNCVERCWTVKSRRWGRWVERLCFRVRCPEGVFDVYQDLRGNTWHIVKAGAS
ncbi:MAG: hypothetical protein HYR71_07470 [Chloroflexi bacterium]|nr:hypothetical protein [Chloroflexota bacterium]